MSSSNLQSTVNDSEVEFFNADSYSLWEENNNLNRFNSVRVPFITDGLLSLGICKNTETENPLKGLKVLDIGCGVGYLSEALAKLGADVTGLDASSNRIKTAKIHAAGHSSTSKIRYIASSMEDHSKEHEDYYDVIVASEIVEHVENPKLFVECCIAALKPGGSIFFTTPGKTIFSWLYVIIMAEYVFGIIPKGCHTYDKFISPFELQQMCESSNCRTVRSRGIFFNLLTRSWSFSEYEGLFYALHAVKNSTKA